MQYKTNSISVIYELEYRFILCHYIQFTSNLKMCFNTHSGNEIMKSNNLKKGFWHKRKFYQLSKIKDKIELIPKYEYINNDFLTNLK